MKIQISSPKLHNAPFLKVRLASGPTRCLHHATLYPALHSRSPLIRPDGLSIWPHGWISLYLSRPAPPPLFFLPFSTFPLHFCPHDSEACRAWMTSPRPPFLFKPLQFLGAYQQGGGVCVCGGLSSTWEDFLLTRQCLKKSNRWLLAEGTWG